MLVLFKSTNFWLELSLEVTYYLFLKLFWANSSEVLVWNNIFRPLFGDLIQLDQGDPEAFILTSVLHALILTTSATSYQARLGSPRYWVNFTLPTTMLIRPWLEVAILGPRERHSRGPLLEDSNLCFHFLKFRLCFHTSAEGIFNVDPAGFGAHHEARDGLSGRILTLSRRQLGISK